VYLTLLDLDATAIPDIWILAAPLVWSDPVRGQITVPAGFKTDLASIPRVLRNLPMLDPDGISRRPAVTHDWLYGTPQGRAHGKAFADDFLYDALLAEGASKATAWAFWAGVHFGGQLPWDNDGARL
jgi:hypothetical protein